MAADALWTPFDAKPSASIILTTQDKHVIVLHEEGFQFPVPFLFWEMIDIAV